MDEFLKVEIEDMTDAQLKEMLTKLRERRKVGYEIKPRGRREANPFADLDPAIAEKILKRLSEGGGGDEPA